MLPQNICDSTSFILVNSRVKEFLSISSMTALRGWSAFNNWQLYNYTRGRGCGTSDISTIETAG